MMMSGVAQGGTVGLLGIAHRVNQDAAIAMVQRHLQCLAQAFAMFGREAKAVLHGLDHVAIARLNAGITLLR